MDSVVVQLLALFLGGVAIHIVIEPVFGHLSKRAPTLKLALKATITPLKTLIWLLLLLLGWQWAWERWRGEAFFDNLEQAQSIVWLACLTWFFLNWKDLVVEHAKRAKDGWGKRLDVGVFSKVSSAFVVGVGGLLVLEALGFSVQALIAFGGVGGIAVAFAAQDLISNFFGGLMVHSTRLFREGDQVSIPDRHIEGWVEEIGWYMTRIRNLERRALYVPNSAFAKAVVINISRQTHRRILDTIDLRYSDLSALPTVVQAVERYLNRHEAIQKDIPPLVRLETFGDYSLSIQVMAFTAPVPFAEFKRIKEEVLLGIARLVEEQGASMAYPTTTLDVPEPVRISE